MKAIHTIQKIEFRVTGKDQVLKSSVLPIDSQGIRLSELYENQLPKKEGLLDPRLGTSQDNIMCATCGLNSKYCPGHFGHIKLSTPMLHIGFIPYIIKTLNCVCSQCSKLRFDDEKARKIHKLEDAVIAAKDIKKCWNCGISLLKFDIEKKNYVIYAKTKDEETNQRYFFPKDIMRIFQKISIEDAKTLGFSSQSRPEGMIYDVFPVPPIAIRPSVKVPGMTFTRDDDLTKKLANIVKSNNKWSEEEAKIITSFSNDGISEAYRQLQFALGNYYDNDVEISPTERVKNTNSKSLLQRIESKSGIIRGHLMGKRVDYCGRSVITADTNIKIDEIGIPISIAKVLTCPEYVNWNNIQDLQQKVINGPKKYPGANYIIRKTDNGYTKPIDLSIAGIDKKHFELKIGDIVERHLINGDVVLFNRQPSLHKYSMMSHYASIIDDNRYASFRLNVGVTTPYNADYDGDEMNIIVPRSIQTRIELEELAAIKKQLVNIQTSLPLIGCKIDTITGVYILTSFSDLVISSNDVQNILSGLQAPIDKPFPNKIPDEGLTGKEFISCIIPKKVNVTDNKIVIKNGELIKGFLTNAYLSSGQSNSLIQLIFELYDDKEAKKFFNNIQDLINQFNLRYSFTTDFNDIIYDKLVQDKVNTKILSVIDEVNRYVTETEDNPTLNTPEVFEADIVSRLSNIRSTLGEMVMAHFHKNNNIFVIKNSGSSGKVKPDTISKNIITEAQHASQGGRIQKKDGRRTMPYFCRDLDTPRERGFNVHNLLSGLQYPEFVYNNITGREALINIQLKTAESGYIQRKLTKTMEDFQTAYDGTVRDIANGIIQFSYSDSNINPIYQHRYDIKSLTEDFKTIREKYIFNSEELKKYNWTSEANEKFFNEFKELKQLLTESTLKFRRSVKCFENSTTFLLPININKLNSIILQFNKSKETIKPDLVIQRLNQFFDHNETYLLPLYNHGMKEDDEKLIKSAFKLAIYEVFAPKRVILEYQLSESAFNQIMLQLVESYEKSLIEPGEMVGITTGQSICENITQTNLRSHHLTGVVSKTAANAGVSRIQEIFNVSKNIQTPSMQIVLKDSNNKKKAEEFAAHIQVSKFGEFINGVDVTYQQEVDPEVNPFSKIPKSHNCRWLATFYLNKEELFLKNVRMLDIIQNLANNWESSMENKSGKKNMKKNKDIEQVTQCLFYASDDNADNLIVQIKFAINLQSYSGIYYFINEVLENIRIQGIDNIKAAEIRNNEIEPYYEYNPETGAVEKREQWVITTAGINYNQIIKMRNVDTTKTFMNDVPTILEIYGIEAARGAIIDEMLTLVDNTVNYNHMSVLIDYMTRTGTIIPINRNGIKRSNASLLSKITFEQQVAQLLGAAVSNGKDAVNGVSSRIMTGRVPKCGTGFCDVAFDVDYVVNSQLVPETNENVYVDITENDLIDQFNKNDNQFIPALY